MTDNRVREFNSGLLFTLSVFCLALTPSASMAQHADVLVNVMDQKLGVNENLFLADFRGGLNSGSDILELRNPGYATQKANQLLGGTLLSFDVLGPLLFSDGTSWRPAGSEHYLQVFRPLVESHSATITGESDSQNGFLLAQADDQGVIHEHIRFQLGTETDTAPAKGVYAFQQVLTSPTYADSDPFMLAFNNGLETSGFIQSVVAARQIIADSEFDCSGDGLLTARDLSCVREVIQRDNILRSISSVAGDLDGNLAVDFADFLTLSQNFGQDSESYAAGNIDLSEGVGFPDFLIMSRNFGFDSSQPLATVPEPSSGFITFITCFCLPVLQCRRLRRHHRSGNSNASI